jgi:5-enolpyruvylshikimate-3-phosphate synthase
MMSAVGVTVESLPNGIAIHGGAPRAETNASVETHDDHRTAMSVAALAAGAGEIAIDTDASIDVSFPGFSQQLSKVQG